MKKIATAILMFTMFTATAQIDSLIKKSGIPDSAKVTFSTVYKDAKEAIMGLSGALKVGSEHVYEVLIKQQVVNSITFLSLFAFSVFLLIFGYKQADNVDKKAEEWMRLNNKKSADDFFHFSILFSGASIFMGGIMILVAIFNIDDLIMGFVNPEYGAIKDIMDFVKK